MCLFGFHIVSLQCFAGEGISLSQIQTYFLQNGIQATTEYVYGSKTDGGWKETEINEVMLSQGTKEEVDVKWWSRPFPENNILRIKTETNQVYFLDNPLTTEMDAVHSCWGSASSDTLILSLDASKHFAYEWSCGSSGCSFYITLAEQELSDYSQACQDW